MHKDVHTGELSENEEMYLETIFSITEKGGVARTTELSVESGVSPASVTEMMQKLGRLGYVDYRPFQGVTLTKKGLDHATRIIRLHRLLELFLTRIVGLGGDRARKSACEMEHAAPPEFERWVCDELGHPREGVEGVPIPPGACCPAGRP